MPASFRLSEGQFKEHFLQTQMAVKSDLPKDGPQGAGLEWVMDRNSYPKNRDEFEQKTTKITKRTTCASKPTHLLGEAIRGIFFYGSALLPVLCEGMKSFSNRCGSEI